jgi:hypothetical protein
MTRTLLPIVALGGGLAAMPAAALELGELTVHSNLGQPLRASIAYALAPNEMLSNTCVSIGQSTSGLPSIGGTTISITERAIIIAGDTSIREPMLGTRVTVNCPYTPNLSREYMLFVDPGNTAQANEPVAPVTSTRQAPNVAPASASKTPVASGDELMEPIGQSSRYQAKVGDTLSGIVSRIENRSIKLWPAVNAIFQANPDAFVDNDPNKLKAGSWLVIPSLDGTVPVVAEVAPVAVTPVQDAPPAASDAESGASAVYESPAATEVPVTAVPATTDTPVEAAVALTDNTVAVTDSTSDLRPGDVVLGSDNPFVEPAGDIVIADTELPGPETTSTSPNVPTAIITTGSRNESTSMLTWLIGGGFAIVAGLILFGRRARGRFGSTPVGPVVNPSAVPAPADTDKFDPLDELDYDISDDSPTEENLALDADLVIGTGLGESTGMDVAESFGFADTTELDIELPFEPQAEVSGETDIIPPIGQEMESILESEVLPEDDDYDMSVIMDATKMPHPEDVTERDLMAVPVGTDDGTLISDNYTISKEVDYDILEQDYEDEMTATQALNEEIARAAAELVEDLKQDADDEATSELSLASVTELDVTAQLPQQDEQTAEMPHPVDPNDTAAVTVNMSADDETTEMHVANDDETVEMDVEGGTTVNTRRA